jgi:hypothetical protein
MSERIDVVLTERQAANPFLEQLPLGPGAASHITDPKVEAWLGRRPVVVGVSEFMQVHNLPEPEMFQLLNDHEIWLVFYAFGIYQRSNFKEVVRARFEVEYGDSPAVTIFQLFPTTELTTWGDTGGVFATDFQLSEETPASKVAPGDKAAPITGLLGESHASVKVGGKVSLSLNLKVATAKLTAAGINNDYGLWEFRKHDVPLVGDQQVGHILLVRKPVGSAVKAKLRLSIDVGYFSFWTSPRYTPWNDVEIKPPAQKATTPSIGA